MAVISRVEFQISEVVGSLGENLKFFSPMGFDVQTNYGHKTLQNASKCYLNEKNLLHGRVMATVSKFSPQIFEIYFSRLPKWCFPLDAIYCTECI